MSNVRFYALEYPRKIAHFPNLKCKEGFIECLIAGDLHHYTATYTYTLRNYSYIYANGYKPSIGEFKLPWNENVVMPGWSGIDTENPLGCKTSIRAFGTA